MSKVLVRLTDAQEEKLLDKLRCLAAGMQVQPGVWSRTASALLDLVLQARSEEAAKGPRMHFELQPEMWFTAWEIKSLCSSGPSPDVQQRALRWVRGLPGNASYDPEANPAWSSQAEAYFEQITVILSPAVAELRALMLSFEASEQERSPNVAVEIDSSFIYIDGKGDRNWRSRTWFGGLTVNRISWGAAKAWAGLRGHTHPRTWVKTLRVTAGAVWRLAVHQLREIRAELTRAMRPVAKVRVLRDYGVAMTKAARYGGGTILVPIRNASTAETLGVAVEEQRDGFGVSVYSAAAVEGRTSLRVERWKIDGVTDRLAAEQLKQRIERAMVQSAGGAGGSVWPKALAAAAVVVVAVGLLSNRAPKPEGGEQVASAQAEQQSMEEANAALAALFGAPANAMPVNGEAIPAEIMAEVLAGAGLDPAAAAELQAAGGNDPWVAQAMASAKQVAQETIFQQGAVGTPPPDPSLKQFGLGNTIAGCDPALSFKVSE